MPAIAMCEHRVPKDAYCKQCAEGSTALAVPEPQALAALPDPEAGALALIERGRIALAEVQSQEEAKSIFKQTKVLEAVVRSVELTKAIIVDASELRIRAERRVGELSPPPEMGRPPKSRDESSQLSTKPSAGERKQATRARKLAKLPPAKFEKAVGATKEKALEGGGQMTAETVLREATPRKTPERLPDDLSANVYQGVTGIQNAFRVRTHLRLIPREEIGALVKLASRSLDQWRAVLEALQEAEQ